jgi:hypothetical protein
VASSYDPSLTMAEARAHYFEHNGIPADGGYSRRWVKVTRNRLPLYLLNTAPRRRAVPLHDLHHVLTEYDTSNAGEGEISAWELAAGTRPHWIALFLDLSGLAVGLMIAPRRTFRAFVRGRRSRSLYSEALTPELLSTPVGAVRERLPVAGGVPRASAVDVLIFGMAAVSGLATLLSLIIFLPVVLAVGLLLP